MKRLACLTAALLISTAAFAEDAAPGYTPPANGNAEAPNTTPVAAPVAPAVAPTAAPVAGKFYFELEPADLTALSQAIVELPKKIADPLLLKLNGQLQSQIQPQLKANNDAVKAPAVSVPAAAPHRPRLAPANK